MIKKITIPYFPMGLKYITPVIFGAGIYLVIRGYFVFAVLLILVGAVIITSKYVTEINLNLKTYSDYLFILGIPINEKRKKFSKIDRIVITKGNYTQTINTRAQSRQMDWADYTGTLLLDQNDTLELLTKTDKKELLHGLKEFIDFLRVGVEDRTTNQYFWIDVQNLT